jgi:hypothetical protein
MGMIGILPIMTKASGPVDVRQCSFIDAISP